MDNVKLNQLVAANQDAFNSVIRRYRIIPEATNFETINKGFRQRGTAFETDLIRALAGSYVNYTDENGNEVTGPEEYNYNLDPAAPSGSNFWTVFNQILGGASALGATFAKVRTDVTGEYTPDQLQAQTMYEAQKAKQTQYLMIGAVIAIVLIVILLIFKK